MLNKYDMMPYFEFDEKKVSANYDSVNPDAPLFCVSSRSGEGLDALAEYLAGKIEGARS